jgi:hypothetical protein
MQYSPYYPSNPEGRIRYDERWQSEGIEYAVVFVKKNVVGIHHCFGGIWLRHYSIVIIPLCSPYAVPAKPGACVEGCSFIV